MLRDVSFSVEPNEMVAIVGHTGAGKTSLINLLLRFYEPQRGQILVGGRDIREWPRQELRRQFGVVLQDPALLSGTIAENIRLGDASIDQKRLVEARRQDPARRAGPAAAGRLRIRRWASAARSFSAGQRQLVGSRPRAGAQSAVPGAR